MEQKKEYTYSMPQAFMDDASVPTHWRLLGYLNGFFINGNSVWASSATIAEELGVSERSIRTAVNKLEELKFITVERTKTTRIIQPFTRKPISAEVGNQFPQGRKPISAEVGNQFPNNSDKLIQINNSISTKVDEQPLNLALSEYQKMRTKIRKPLTDRAKELLLKKLDGYSEAEQIDMLEEATLKCWQSVYPPKIPEKNQSFKQAIASYNFT